MKALLSALAFIAIANCSIYAQEAPRCLDVSPKDLKEGEILFMFTSESQADVLEPLVIFDGSEFKQIHNRYFRGIDEAYDVSDGKSVEISYDTYSVLPGDDKCYWAAKLEKSKKKELELFSYPNFQLDTKINDDLEKQFYSLNTACVTQMDDSNNPRSSCTRPVLKGVSDLNKNGKMEFWYTWPQVRETGFAVAEVDESGTKLNIIAEK
jgi:hypothetical protein